MLMLEANFAKNLDELIDPPNLPELEVEAMPVNPVPGLAVFKASDRDQKTIKDPEYGIGLFTRYLIEGLAGRADAAPLGNDDKRIDTVELYVYTADAVRTAARKSFGLEQKPMLGKIDNLVVGNLSVELAQVARNGTIRNVALGSADEPDYSSGRATRKPMTLRREPLGKLMRAEGRANSAS